MKEVRHKAILGTFFHAPAIGSIEILEDALVGIDGAGRIASVVRAEDPGRSVSLDEADAKGCLIRLPRTSFMLPGFVDLHIHAPQYPQLGIALHVPLEVWLRTHTFPLEARYADIAFAERAYSALIDDLLALGTTTAVFFATIHREATKILVDICLRKGMRALVGKVAMDNPISCPDYYRDASVGAAIEGTMALIEYVRGHTANRDGLVLPAITPRFIPSCTDELLEGLGALAQSSGCHVQTHCSESDWEHGAAFSRYGRSDAESLDGFGLMTRRTVLAHSNFVSDSDMDLIAGGAPGSPIAHYRTPTSRMRCFRCGERSRGASCRARDRHLRWPERLPARELPHGDRGVPHARRRRRCAAAPEGRGQADSRIDWKTAFHLATAGGAKALDLPIGRFEPGNYFDAIAVDTEAPDGTVRLFDDSLEAVLQKIIYTASKPNITDVWVAGRRVAGRAQ